MNLQLNSILFLMSEGKVLPFLCVHCINEEIGEGERTETNLERGVSRELHAAICFNTVVEPSEM